MAGSKSSVVRSKKNDQLRERSLALRRRPIRLAVLRSVALSRSRARRREAHLAAMAPPRAGRNLRFRPTRCKPQAPFAVLRIEEPARADRAAGAERELVAAVARCPAAGLSRRRRRRG